MSRQASPISGKPYGLAAVCRVWRLARSGIYRQRTPVPAPALHRRGPFGPMPDAALLRVAANGTLPGCSDAGSGLVQPTAALAVSGGYLYATTTGGVLNVCTVRGDGTLAGCRGTASGVRKGASCPVLIVPARPNG